MAGILKTVNGAFWSEYVWLPPNVTWEDVAPGSREGILTTDYRHLYIPLPMALVLLTIRYCLEKYWFGPVGISLGIKNSRPKKAPNNPVLEKAFLSNHKQLKHKHIQGLAKQLDWSERQVERWLRLRRSQEKPTTLVKFTENAWRCLYYIFSFCYGLIILWDKPWLWNINECWNGYPFQSITNDSWWYYMFSLSFYWSLCVSQFFDNKRKDFWQMFVHHIATIILMSFSWVCNLVRIGTLVLVTHDCADIFLEAAKMAKYAGYQRICDAIFAFFTVLWIVTRLGVFPFWIIHNTTIVTPTLLPVFPAYYIFNGLLLLLLSLHIVWTYLILKIAYKANGLLLLLLSLHIVWTYLILKIAYKALMAGQMEGDIRSSSSNYSDSSKSQNLMNGNKIGSSSPLR
ncbi:TLC domain [Popillia japonica]|uniref:TLC domain n=1 Tax=Popillia japonica TaxID=7064 RepID=A0AAW1N7J7_POPJA